MATVATTMASASTSEPSTNPAKTKDNTIVKTAVASKSSAASPPITAAVAAKGALDITSERSERSERRKHHKHSLDRSDRSTHSNNHNNNTRGVSTETSERRRSSTSMSAMDISERRKKRMSDMSERSSFRLPNASQVSDDGEASLGNLFATKGNSAFKWQRARGVVGALEVPSEPFFRFHDPLVPHKAMGREHVFDEGLVAWRNLKLREDFIHACENLPSEMCCCGLLSDEDATKRRFVTLLNEGWCRRTNKKLLSQKTGFKVDAFLWNWQNASGKSESNIVLIRFFETSAYRFTRASDEGSVDFELLDAEDEIMNESDEDEADFDEDNKAVIIIFPPEGTTMDR